MKIRVDIEELVEKLEAMLEDNYVTVELDIEDDEYLNELHVSAVSFETDPLSYGSLTEVEEELF